MPVWPFIASFNQREVDIGILCFDGNEQECDFAGPTPDKPGFTSASDIFIGDLATGAKSPRRDQRHKDSG
jgi:hypothetical protein